MQEAAFYDRVQVSTSTTGTGSSVAVGSAVPGYLTPAEAGVQDGAVVNYVIEDGDDFEFQIGQTYSSSGPSLSRGTPSLSKISGTVGTSQIELSGSARVAIVPFAKQLNDMRTVVTPQMFGAVADGVTDDAAAINAALAGGNVHVYFPAGEYLCKSYLRVYSNTKVELHPDAKLIHASSSSYLFLNGEAGNSSYATGYSGEGNLWFTGGTIDCSPKVARTELCEPIAIAHAENVLIENMRFTNNYQDHMLELNSTRHAIVRNCIFENTTLSSPGSREFINIDHAGGGGFPHFGSLDGTICEDILIESCVFRNGDVAVGSHSAPPSNHKKIIVRDCYVDTMESCGFDVRYWDKASSRVERTTIKNVPTDLEFRISGNFCIDGRYFCFLADDTATAIPVPKIFANQNPQGLVLIGGWSNVSASPRGLYWVHAAPTTNVVEIAVYSGSTDVVTTTGALAGTTGTDGKVTISAHTDGNIYIENRRGASLRLDVKFMAS